MKLINHGLLSYRNCRFVWTLEATITDLRQEAGQNLVECDILMLGAQGERHVGGKAVISLPTRT